jgi:2-hydroxy-3-keto-5-methylthiopentenyl-1-phosphate phosphatase
MTQKTTINREGELMIANIMRVSEREMVCVIVQSYDIPGMLKQWCKENDAKVMKAYSGMTINNNYIVVQIILKEKVSEVNINAVANVLEKCCRDNPKLM